MTGSQVYLKIWRIDWLLLGSFPDNKQYGKILGLIADSQLSVLTLLLLYDQVHVTANQY